MVQNEDKEKSIVHINEDFQGDHLEDKDNEVNLIEEEVGCNDCLNWNDEAFAENASSTSK